MSIAVDTGHFASAMDTFYLGNHRVSDAVGRAQTALRGCPAMAGGDTGGADWAASYDDVATDMLRAGAGLGAAMGSVANLLNASLVNHEGAEHGALLHGAPACTSGDPAPGHGTTHLAVSALPSAAGGLGDSPPGWHWLAGHLEGYVWPDADTDAMRTAGRAWQDCAAVLDDAHYAVGAAASTMGDQWSPEVPTVLLVCAELKTHCTDLSVAYHDVGQACLDYADQVEDHHREVVHALEELVAWTVVDQVTGALLSLVTGGGAEVAAQLVEAGIMGRYAAKIVGILKRLVELARAAARVIGTGVAKVAQIAGRLKRFLGAKVLLAIERFGSAAAKAELAAVRQALHDAETGLGHTIGSHVGLSDQQLAQRIAREGIDQASSFVDLGTATREIGKVLASRSTAIAEWLGGAARKLELDADAGRVIGRTLVAGGKAVDASLLRVVLRRDPQSPVGYIILTSFPK